MKARGFVLDRDTGRPVPGVVVIATAIPDEGVSLTLGVHASDKAGYLAFSFERVFRSLKHLWLHAIGYDDTRVDLMAQPWWNTPGPHFILFVNESTEQCLVRPPFPSVADPDVRDWELSPRSFATLADITLGEDGCATGCETMLPSTVAERDYRIRRVVRRWTGNADRPDNATNLMNPLDPWSVPFNENEFASLIMDGEVLEYRQRWFPLGHSLGEMVYSLPLAPCESVNVAVIDWSRQDSAARQDDIRSTEALFHKQRRDRTIDETVDAALNEEQGGWSLMGGGAQATSAQEASSGQASATIPIEGIPVNLAGAASQSLGFGQLFSIGGGIANSWGNRDLSGSSRQDLHDKTLQSTAVLRTLSSTVVIQSTQQEQGTVQTRTVTNHNHCHSLTVQYYEVLRHFRIETAFVGRRSIILIPYRAADFTWSMALRFRTILEPLVDARVQGCFDAVVRLHHCPDLYALPADDTGDGLAGGTEDPDASSRPIAAFAVTPSATTWNWSTTWGEIWVDVWVKSKSNWVTIWHKDPMANKGSEFNKIVFPQQVSGQNIDAADIDKVQVRWQEDNNNDSWDLKGIKITYEISGEAGTHTLIDQTGSSVPAGSKSNEAAIRYFDDSGQQPLSTTPLAALPPPPVPTGGGAPVGGGAPSTPLKPGARGKYSREEDACCEQRLLLHLNGNIGFYSRAIWILQDPVERRVMLDAALSTKPWLAGGVDETPVGVSGTHVAFPYTRAEDEGEEADTPEDPTPLVDIVSLPTRGLFAESQLGHCNSCELRDVTRFWQWEGSPCPEKAPTIEGIRPGPTGQPVTVTPTSLPAPIVQVMSSPAAPDPVGLAAALKVLGTPNIFRDMSGTKEVADLLKGLASGAMSLADAQKLAEKVSKDLEGSGGTTPMDGEGGDTPTEPDAGKQVDKLNAIDYGREKGLLTNDAAQRAAEGVVGGRLLASADAGVAPEPVTGEKPDATVLAGIAADARLKESYDKLVSDGWEIRRTNIYFGNSSIDSTNKILYIDDDIEPVATTTKWAADAVRKAYQDDDDYRLRAVRDQAIAIFTTANLTDLERMARTFEWAVWFWRYPSDSGDAGKLLDDMMLVLTDLEPSGLSLNNGTYHIFRAGLFLNANSTGFKHAFRDDSNQVRHTTGSIQASYFLGPAGFGAMQSRESSTSADWRLNSRCHDIAMGLKRVDPSFRPRDIGAILRRELGDPSQTGPWTGPADGDPNATMP